MADDAAAWFLVRGSKQGFAQTEFVPSKAQRAPNQSQFAPPSSELKVPSESREGCSLHGLGKAGFETLQPLCPQERLEMRGLCTNKPREKPGHKAFKPFRAVRGCRSAGTLDRSGPWFKPQNLRNRHQRPMTSKRLVRKNTPKRFCCSKIKAACPKTTHYTHEKCPWHIRAHLAMGQHPVPPVNIPIPTKIGSTMGGEFTYPQNGINHNGFDYSRI